MEEIEPKEPWEGSKQGPDQRHVAARDRIHHPARLYEKHPEQRVRCLLCAHRCWITDGKFGACQVRQNLDGVLYTLVYGHTISHHVDPIEKKPLFHYYPGTAAFSIATPGCNYRCRWCQNWSISQLPRERDQITGQPATPHQIVSAARATGSQSIAYTYTEPTIFFEYALDCAQLANAEGLGNVLVTNGYMTREMLEAFQPYVDAANVDLKSFRDHTYRKYVGARLQPVLDSMRAMKQFGIWLEVTTLVIPGLNDDLHELREMAEFILLELGHDTPWHISRFYPAYQMADRPPTPVETLQKAYDLGREAGLRYVYLGNLAMESNTSCHGCGRVLIRRRGYWITENHIQNGRCVSCGSAVAGLGLDSVTLA